MNPRIKICKPQVCLWRFLAFAVSAASVLLQLSTSAQGQAGRERVLYSFTGGSDGSLPGNLIPDRDGNFYGIAFGGGLDSATCGWDSVGCGVVYKLTATANGSWSETVLYQFTGGADGDFPSLLTGFDKAGNLYGTATFGGDTTSPNCLGGNGTPPTPPGCGVIFKLTPTAEGQWTETTLYTFTGGTDGGLPNSGVARDLEGNLYGVVSSGGAYGGGAVYKLSRTATAPWTYTTLYSFTGGGDGFVPGGLPVFDSKGDLYGTTEFGGNTSANCLGYGIGCGVVFKLTPGSNNIWTESVLYAFSGGADGGVVFTGVTLDGKDNAYGMSYSGGNTSCGGGYGCGVVYRLAQSSAVPWKESILHAFTGGSDGGNSLGVNNLTFGPYGRLYGTTPSGGDVTSSNCAAGPGCGVAFALWPDNGIWQDEILYTFPGGAAGGVPQVGIIFDAIGNAYGTADAGGLTGCSSSFGSGCGLVFELLSNSGGERGER